MSLKIGEYVINAGEKVGKKKLRGIFETLAKDKEEIEQKKCLEFYTQCIEAFGLNYDKRTKVYENEEMAVKSYAYSSYHEKISDLVGEYIKNKLRYFPFQFKNNDFILDNCLLEDYISKKFDIVIMF